MKYWILWIKTCLSIRMVTCKLLVICLAVVAMNARLSQTHFLNDLRDCTCFPTDKGRVRISNLADKHGKHERIVVYIFKHSATGKVTVYVPSQEKQIKFPDLTVNSLESYGDYTIENLYQIINNPKVSIVDSSHPIHTHLINLQIPDVPNYHHVIKHKPPHIIKIKPDIKPHKNGKKTVSTDLLDIEVDLQVNGHKEIDDKKTKHPHKPVIETVNIVPGPFSNYVNVPDNIHMELDQNKKISDLDIINVIDVQKTQIPSNMHIKPIILTKPSKETITINNVVQETDVNYISKILNMLNGNNDDTMPSSVSLKQVNNPVFNHWLMEEISNVGTATYDTVEIQKIKIRLLLVLEQNGLRFSENGDLIDINGRIFKISNLKLRRVMISDPVVYKKLGGKCVPHGIPYLEAVFVSLVHPPTVLGVIPLRMTSLPRCKKGKGECKKCLAKKDKHLLVGLRLPQKLNLAPIHGTKLGLIPRMGSEDENENVLATRVDQNEDLLPTPFHTGVEKNEDLLPTSLHTGVDKNEDLLPTPLHTGEDINEDASATLVYTGIHDGHDRRDDDKSLHIDDNEDGLGIRIIGGRPATSSGTPVSSKGRSGNQGVSSSV